MRMVGRIRPFMLLLLGQWLVGCTPPSTTYIECPDIHHGCQLDGLVVATNHPPEIMKPFILELRWVEPETAAGLSEVHASFAMEGMEMGLNRYRLSKVASDIWQAEIILPLCVRGRADWQMQIDAKTRFSERQYQLGFYTN